MKVLVGCEFSATVREAFAALGHEAWSCDLLASDLDGLHFQADVKDVLSLGWDLAILHPPCTALAGSGNRHYAQGKPKHQDRLCALDWTVKLWDLALGKCDAVAMENPVGVLSSWKKPSQVIHPWQFGHPERKATCLWLHNLPVLQATQNVFDLMLTLPVSVQNRVHHAAPYPDRWKQRSKTYAGVAAAMAAQWGGAFVQGVAA